MLIIYYIHKIFTHDVLYVMYNYKQVWYEDSEDNDEDESLLLRPWWGVGESSSPDGVVFRVVVVVDEGVSFFKNMSEVRLAILIIWVCSIWYLRPFKFLYRFLQFPREQV